MFKPGTIKGMVLVVSIIVSTLACATLFPEEDRVTEMSSESTTAPSLSTLTPEDYPRVDGSTSTLPLDTLIACHLLEVPCGWVEWLDNTKILVPEMSEFEGEFPEIVHHGTHESYVNLITGTADLILVARVPSQDEAALAAEKGVSLVAEPIALDAFVFILNIQNPVDNLAIAQIQGIYTGMLTNWSQVGGLEAEIHPYTRNPNSGSQELMKALVMKDLQLVAAPEMTLDGMMGPINVISDDVNGIGYSVFFFEEFMAPNDQLKLSAVDGVVPSSVSIHNRTYPYRTEVYAVIREDLEEADLAFQIRDWILSEQGQNIIAESGYVLIK